MSLTTDPDEARNSGKRLNGEQQKYVILSEAERRKGFVRPLRYSYRHDTCGWPTSMARQIAETFARDPSFYGGTFCSTCHDHFPVEQFVWEGTDERVGS